MTLETATPTSCDFEAIHLLGTVQPIGFLISVNADWIVVRASENVEEFLGVPHATVVGHPLTACLDPTLLHDIRSRLQQAGEDSSAEPMFRQRLRPGGRLFAVAAHHVEQETVIEFEVCSGHASVAPGAVRSIIARIDRHTEMPAVFREAARQVRAMTGFDRVMVYYFHPDGSGEVVGESARNGMAPFMGLRFPATDIPRQARALYEKSLTRIIADVDAVPVAVSPALSPEGKPLDLSMSVLRSVSSIHLEYLKNMGVRSSMSISLLRGGKLRGLIACHHASAFHLDLEMRMTAELFGQMFAYSIEARDRDAEAAFDERARDIHNRLTAAFAHHNTWLSSVPNFLADLTNYVDSDGIGVYHDGEISLVGHTPTEPEFLDLLQFLNKTASGRVFATDHLSGVFEPASDYLVRAAGILSVPISRIPRDFVVFFRREAVTTVTWAGYPAKIEVSDQHGMRLTPRKSFEAWREIVEGHSKPWIPRELRAAEALRLTLVEMALRVADLAQARQVEAQHRLEMMVAELNHRMRNLLGLVRGLIVLSAASATDVHSLVASLDGRLQAMARAQDQLVLSEASKGSMHALLDAEVSVYGDLMNRFVVMGPDILVSSKAYSAVTLVLHELVTNARKHGALRTPTGKVLVETILDPVGNVHMSWKESGGPLVHAPTRRGFGRTILEQAIPFEVSGTSILHYLPSGFCLDIMLPANVASELPSGLVEPPLVVPHDPLLIAITDKSDDPVVLELLKVAMIVEDNLFIAVDAEDMLRKLGAHTVVVARTVAEAFVQMSEQTVTFAMLDVDLGAETSVPVARALLLAGVPFAFSTGYSEAVVLPESMAKIPVILKPYTEAAVGKALRRLAAAVPVA